MTEKEFRKIYPPEVIELMLQRQEEQGNPRNIEPFLKDVRAGKTRGAFDWVDTPETCHFWNKVLVHKNFNIFYKRYSTVQNNIILLL